MAAVNAMCTMFVRIRYTNAATQVIVIEQGTMDTLDKIQFLTDDEIENLRKAIRQPGGTAPGPNPGDPPIENPGTPVNLQSENQAIDILLTSPETYQ
jgi:hypothetical protein